MARNPRGGRRKGGRPRRNPGGKGGWGSDGNYRIDQTKKGRY